MEILSLVKGILTNNNIRYKDVTPVTGGFNNKVLNVDNKYILKIGNSEESLNIFRNEEELFIKIGKSANVPEILHVGSYENYAYQIQVYIEGEKIFNKWSRIENQRKIRIIDSLAIQLKGLHGHNLSNSFGRWSEVDLVSNTWREYITKLFNTSIKYVQDSNSGIGASIIDSWVSFFEANIDLLVDSQKSTLHGDVWFENIIVDKNDNVTLIDFEYILTAPIEFELVIPELISMYPNLVSSQHYKTGDFSDFVPLLLQSYPDLMKIANLREKVDLYQFVYNLYKYRLRREWELRNDPTSIKFPDYLLARTYNFIMKEGVRMF